MGTKIGCIAVCRRMPAGIFHKSLIHPQIHCHGATIIRADRYKFLRNTQGNTSIFRHLKPALLIPNKTLGSHGLHDPLFIIISLFDFARGTLKKSVISLRIKKPLFSKTCALELMVYICRYDKIILILYQRQQILIHRLGCINITIEINVPCPPCPTCFLIGKRIESTRIHIPYAKTLLKIKEILFEPFTAVGKAGSSRKPRPGTNDYCIGSFELIPKSADVFFPAAGIIGKTASKIAHKGGSLL